MLRLNHYDDCKEKSQSHEISIRECHFYDVEYDIGSFNPFDIYGYGETKEEALEDFKRKFEYVMRELKTFEKMLLETDTVENDTVEVDCFGKQID